MKKRWVILFPAAPLIGLLTAWIGTATPDQTSSNYKETTIGKQVWMTENLNTDTFRNGDHISEARSEEQWVQAGKTKQPAWCYFRNDSIQGRTYGKLYNWYAVSDKRGLAPKGWHIPLHAEWDTLINYLGGFQIAGKKMKSTSGWKSGGNGTNSSGFSGLPGGARKFKGAFGLAISISGWWSSSESSPTRSYAYYLYYTGDVALSDFADKTDGLYIRCVKD